MSISTILKVTVLWICFISFNSAAEIHDVVKKGDINAVKSLLAAKPDQVNAVNESGNSPLHIAASVGNTEIASLLIANGANLEIKNQMGLTPLFFAVHFGKTEAVKLLVEKGAQVNLTNPVLGNLLHRAVLNPPILKILLEKNPPMDAVDPQGGTPLHIAAIRGVVEGARLLIELGADINALDKSKKTPLHRSILATVENAKELAKLLIEKGANVNSVADDGSTPIISAVKQGYTAIVDLILQHGGDVHAKEQQTGRSLLHIAAIKGCSDMVNLLIERGIDVKLKDWNGNNALFYTIKHGNYPAAAKIIDKKITPKKIVKPENYILITDPANGPDLVYANDRGDKVINEKDYPLSKITDDEAFIWYLDNRGWAVKTRSHLFVFDNEESGRMPDMPSLANGWISAKEIGNEDVIALYSTYHALPNTMEFIHAKEDSLKHITYINYKEDTWRGGRNTRYVTGREVQQVDGVRIIPFETREEQGMGSLGFLIQTNELKMFYPSFYPQDIETFKKEIDYLAEQTRGCDIAFVHITPGEENRYASYIVEKLKPKTVIPMDVDRQTNLFDALAQELKKKFPTVKFACVENSGDRFHYKTGSFE